MTTFSHHGQFTVGNAKTVKGETKGYLTAILHFSPATGAGILTPTGAPLSVCPYATEGCITGCLNKAGRGGVPVRSLGPTIQAARARRTREYFADREGYVERLSREISRLQRRAAEKDLELVVRPNGTSDLPALAHALAELHPDVQFYDYTKIPKPWTRQRANYHLTFSRSESNERACQEALAHGVSVAVVFDTPKGKDMPETYWDAPVVDGDETDLRFLDPRGVVVGLRAKGPAKRDCSGFVIRSPLAVPERAIRALSLAVVR